MKNQNIAIIGAGIGGLASAILLARQGCSVTIYEQAERAEPVGAGFLLQPPGQAVLSELGVLDTILQDAVPIFGLQSRTVNGYSILDLDYRELKGTQRHGLGVQRRTIHDALYRAAEKMERIEFRWGHAVDHCETTDQHATVTSNERTDQ
ncbi:MAG: FAD-dependent monooxygenase, partial [Pseudomonadota bacterium]